MGLSGGMMRLMVMANAVVEQIGESDFLPVFGQNLKERQASRGRWAIGRVVQHSRAL